MNRLITQNLLPACALSALMALSACGGGGDSPPQPVAQTISFISPGNQTLGTTPAALVATATSGLAVSFASTTPSVCSANGTTLTLLTAGTCTVAASQGGNANFTAAAPVSNSFTIAVALTAQTITFNSPGNQILGSAPPALAASSTSGLAVAFASTTPSVCTVSGTTLTLVAVGTCTVAASQAGNGTFAAATMVPQAFAVAATPQTITFISPGNQTLGTAPAALVASASSGLPVTLVSTTTGACTASGTTLTLLAVGSCTISASQPGNANVAPAAPVSNTFTIAAATLTAQTITFAQPADQTLGTAPPPLVATSSSGLTVTLASTTTPVCTVLGSALTLVAAGNCTIVASQAGSSSFAAATNVSRTFTVAAAPAGTNAFANSGFELAPNEAGEFADGWQQTSLNTTRSSAQAHSGLWSALLGIPDNPVAGNGTGLFQNSVDHGHLLPISQANWGTSPTLTFWVKGNVSVTGNLNYALRYLDSVGHILNTATAGAVTIWTGNLVHDWTQISRAGITIPAGTTAVFLEMTLATGPTGPAVPCGVDNQTGAPLFCDWGSAAVYLDDVNLPLVP